MTNELNLDAIKAQYGRAVLVVAPWLPLDIESVIEAVPALISEIERLRAELVELAEIEERVEPPINLEKAEIINGWLVERGAHLGDHIPGYGTLPYSDAEPILDLRNIPGYPDEERAEKLSAQIERVRGLHKLASHDIGFIETYCEECHEAPYCPTIQALGGDGE